MSNSFVFLRLVVQGRAVEGVSTTQGYEKLIPLESCSWSLSAKHTPVSATAVRTEVRPGTMQLSKFFDRSSMMLYKCVDESIRFDKAVITMLDPRLLGASDKPPKLMELELVDGTIAEISTSTGGSSHSVEVSEDFSLSFKDITIQYFPLNTQLTGRGTATTVLLECATRN